MNNLTKAQWGLFIASAITIILDYVIANSEALGISSKVLPFITLIKLLYDQYKSFSADNMKEFAKEQSKQQMSARPMSVEQDDIQMSYNLDCYVESKKKPKK